MLTTNEADDPLRKWQTMSKGFCSNILIMYGPDDVLKELAVSKLSMRKLFPWPPDLDGKQKVYNLPESELVVRKHLTKKYGVSNIEDWGITRWGTPKDFGPIKHLTVQGPFGLDEHYELRVGEFKTVWGPPVRALEALYEKYKGRGLDIWMEYIEPECQFMGVVSTKAGEFTDDQRGYDTIAELDRYSLELDHGMGLREAAYLKLEEAEAKKNKKSAKKAPATKTTVTPPPPEKVVLKPLKSSGTPTVASHWPIESSPKSPKPTLTSTLDGVLTPPKHAKSTNNNVKPKLKIDELLKPRTAQKKSEPKPTPVPKEPEPMKIPAEPKKPEVKKPAPAKKPEPKKPAPAKKEVKKTAPAKKPAPAKKAEAPKKAEPKKAAPAKKPDTKKVEAPKKAAPAKPVAKKAAPAKKPESKKPAAKKPEASKKSAPAKKPEMAPETPAKTEVFVAVKMPKKATKR